MSLSNLSVAIRRDNSNEKEVQLFAKTTLGKKLSNLRSKIVDSGEKLLDWTDIENEISALRGNDETHIC